MNKEIILSPVNKNVEEKYLTMLTKQFCEATRSSRKETINVYGNWDEFTNWLIKRKEVISNYKELLEIMKVDYTFDNVAEVEKGMYDSIVTDDMMTKVITPYPRNINDSSRVIKGNLEISDVTKGRFLLSDVIPDVNTFMIQNPYSLISYKMFHKIHNNYGQNIVIGVYGKNHDKDRELKLSILNGLKKELIGNVKLDGGTIGDNYSYALSATMKEATHNCMLNRSDVNYTITDAYSRKYTR